MKICQIFCVVCHSVGRHAAQCKPLGKQGNLMEEKDTKDDSRGWSHSDKMLEHINLLS